MKQHIPEIRHTLGNPDNVVKGSTVDTNAAGLGDAGFCSDNLPPDVLQEIGDRRVLSAAQRAALRDMANESK